MVLVSPAGMPNPPILAQRIMMIPRVGEILLNLKTDYIRKLMIRMAFVFDKNLITQDYFDNLTRSHKIKGTNEVLLRTLRLRFFNTLLGEVHKLSKMDVPILIAWGRQDKSIPFEWGQKMHEILKTSKLEVFEKSGHVCHDEHPERFNQIAIDFLSSGWEF